MKNLIFLLAVFITSEAIANVRLPAIYSDGMVLQQQTDMIIWGWADANEKVMVTVGWNSQAHFAMPGNNGRWQLKIATPKAGGPYTITVTATIKLVIKDVLIGEVWLCSGQSNMVFSLKSSAGADTAIAKANYPTMRYFSVARQYGLEKFDDAPGSKWETTTPAKAGSFSAVAFYFAKKLQDELHVPVGIIYSAWGGTPAEAWIPASVFNADTLLAKYLSRWQHIQTHAGPDSTDYLQKLAAWKSGDTLKSKRPAEPQTVYYFHRPWRQPSVLFNGMIDPVIPFGIKGILWYQGESNVAYANEYRQLLTAMIETWRNKWQQQLPFYIVEIATNGYSDMDAAAQLRDAQQHVASTVPKTGVVVTTDVGEMGDIHYKRKKEVGDRLALLALHNDYKKQGLVIKGPEVKTTSMDGKNVRLKYQVPDLKVSGSRLEGFELGYQFSADSILYKPAFAKLNKDHTVDVWTDDKTKPVSIRFAWLYPQKANLFNSQGLPGFPFTRRL